ncbi:MAG: hypothetical protein KMY53_06660 [Desulfarculus sp.]|nr:hypothetical protein [Pseudomonadota bacterium]MBV1717518.1 hypothetical protein [Desulfarculus sp.]MBU4573282.1 hypothetical protein [Pseudomonadota bacterium]MBU4598127.1 hypothetical protein [Pseudomonadota bacterium]MBV1737827.1 hypothetical protein [Desulfarculus sp.]
MGDDAYIQALNQAVKQEIVQNYFRERRIIEEEILLVTEAVSGLLGGLYAWEKHRARLGRALGDADIREKFFDAAGIIPPRPESVASAAPAVGLTPIRGLTRAARYASLIQGLYKVLVDEAAGLEDERQRAIKLMKEVNQDILAFEANHDLMMLESYLRSMNPDALQKRKILGVNFTAKEKAVSAEALSFKPLKAKDMILEDPLPKPKQVSQVMEQVGGLLKQALKRNPQAGAEFF